MKKIYGIFIRRGRRCFTIVLVIPEDFAAGKELVVESLNFEGTNIINKIVPHVIEQLKGMAEVIDDAPILIPFTPDSRRKIQPCGNCFCFKIKVNLERIDITRLQ